MAVFFSLKSLRSTSLAVLPILVLIIQLVLVDAHGGSHDEDSPYSGDHSSTSKKLHSKKLILVKIWCLIIFFFSTFIFGVSPYFLRWNESFLVLGTQFAGGIFLGTSLMHFLSDSTATFKDLTPIDYPFSFMLACAGYLITMFGDCIVGYVARRSVSKTRVEVEEAGKGPDDGELSRNEGLEHNPAFLKTTSMGDTVLLILALCFHSIFEGIAVGIADNETDAWRNLWTITLHKVFAAIAMGIALLRMMPTRAFLASVVYSFAFAISSPIGVGIGIAIGATTEGRAADWTYAITMGFACGIFVYVAINHLISKGYKPQSRCYCDTSFFKFSAVLLGVAVMAVVMIWD